MLSKTIKYVAAATVAMSTLLGSVQAEDVITFGAVAPKTGPLSGGSAVSHWPTLELWKHDVNANGGIMVNGKRMKVEIIEYDDRTNPGETAKAVERAMNQDKVDFMIGPYGTGLVLAAAPMFHKNRYPMVNVAAISDKGPELVQRWDNSFYLLGASTPFAESVAEVLTKLNKAGKIGKRVAMVNVGDAFGIELANAGRKAIKDAGFDIVYDTSYPLGTQDLAPVIKGAKDSNPDAFIAWSYPPDTFGLTEQAKIAGLNTKVFYVGVGSAFPAYAGKFGASAEGVMGAGGVDPYTDKMKAYRKRHQEVTGKAPDYWGGPVTYAALEILTQAIEAVGKDRQKVIEHIKNGSFDTVMGTMKLENNINHKYWTVGQWQNGDFVGIASTGKDGEKEPVVKNGW